MKLVSNCSAVYIESTLMQLTLKRIEAGKPIDPETTFSLLSNAGVSYYSICIFYYYCGQKNGVVTKRSYVKIKHIHSGKNLSVQGKKYK